MMMVQIGGEGMDQGRGGVHRLWDPPCPGHLFKVPRESSLVRK